MDGDADGDEEVEYDSDERERMRELISKKLQRDKGTEKAAELDDEERGKKPSRRYDAASLFSDLVRFFFLVFLFLIRVRNEHFSQCVMCYNDLLGELLTLLMQRCRQSPSAADHPNLGFPNIMRICKSRSGKAVGIPDLNGEELHRIYFDV